MRKRLSCGNANLTMVEEMLRHEEEEARHWSIAIFTLTQSTRKVPLSHLFLPFW